MIRTIRAILATLILVASVAYGLYFGLYLMFYGGLVAIVEGIKATPTQFLHILLGLVMMAITKFAISVIVSFGYLISQWVMGDYYE